MFCKQCGYRLWNLPSRVCPECGTAFKPSDFEFTLNSVEFRCPHCAQGYYGTGLRGHLVPSAFDCVRCGRHVHMDDMVLLPTAGIEEDKTRVEPMPWLERGRLGAFKGWWGTVKMALVRPPRLMELTPETGATVSVFWFAIVSNLVIYLIFMLPMMVFSLAFAGGGRGGPGAWAAVGSMALFALAPPVFVMAAIVIGGMITHMLLLITGRTHAGLARTWHALCLASGANVISAIPCLGIYFGWIWPLVSAVLMVREGQKVSGLRASFAVLAGPLTVMGGFIALSIWGFASLRSFTSSAGYSMMPAYVNSQSSATARQPLLDAIKVYANDHDGRGPKHAIELLTGNTPLGANDLFDSMYSFDLSSNPVGGTTLSDFEDFEPPQQTRVVNTAIASLPDNVVAHRLGDCVFSYHGIDFRNVDPRLWVLVRLSKVPMGASGNTLQHYVIVRADGKTEWQNQYSISALLSTQNRIRAEHQLAPLPDPAAVTPESPAAATFDPSLAPPDEAKPASDDEQP